MEVGRRGRGRGAQRAAEEGLQEEIRILTPRLEAVEARRRRDLEVGDDSEEEAIVTIDGSDEEGSEMRLLRSVLLTSSKPKPEIPNYDGSLSTEVLLDWISELDKYSEFEEVHEDQRVKFDPTNLKGHATLWWDSVQAERRRMNKFPIKKWPRMVAKLKSRFMPKDYQIALHRQVQNLRQKGMTVREYTEEFYQVNLRAGYMEDTLEKTKISSKTTRTTEKGDNTRGGRPYQRGRGNRRGRGANYQCNRCHKWGHRSFECPEVEQVGQRGAYVAQPEEAEAPSQEAENVSETGEALVLNKVLVKPAKEIVEQTQRKALFWTVCKSHGKCCKLIIDSGSTDNLVATEMVGKLGLKRLKHPTPYKVSWLQKGHQLLVDEQCEVKFHIGRYEDKVICDIMPMDVGHILLGRPWQYDRKVGHDGKTNCYKFVKDGIKHTLVPIKEEETAETSGTRVLLMGGK
eukprot:PITA_21874